VSLLEAVKKANRVYIIGNGGSYANAIHICNDLLSSGIKAHTLDPAFLTATANDLSYDQVFARWIRIVGEPGDLLIALSGSGTSKNIMRALHEAKKMEMETVLVTDYLKSMDMQHSEEEQLRVGHQIMKELRGR
jgi:D-sedoheptulose 7-phosphate isomerase